MHTRFDIVMDTEPLLAFFALLPGFCSQAIKVLLETEHLLL
jgi:hypothetical protein